MVDLLRKGFRYEIVKFQSENLIELGGLYKV